MCTYFYPAKDIEQHGGFLTSFLSQGYSIRLSVEKSWPPRTAESNIYPPFMIILSKTVNDTSELKEKHVQTGVCQ